MINSESRPSLSVLLPVYNGGLYLERAIESILKQSFTDFELIIVNDNSSDDSEIIINNFNDSRIIYLKNDVNKRTAFSLNRAIDHAKGKYLVRMDQDDICYPDRFLKQFEFMESHPHVGISGTQMKTFGIDHKSFVTEFPIDHDEIRLQQLYKSPFAHPTVIMRRSLLVDNDIRYEVNYIAEDYSLWSKLLPVTTAANLPEVLLDYRIHPKSITKTFFKRIFKEQKRIRLDYARDLFSIDTYLVKALYSPSYHLRKLAIAHLGRRQSLFSSKVYENVLQSFNNYFLDKLGWRYYLNRVKSKLSAIRIFK